MLLFANSAIDRTLASVFQHIVPEAVLVVFACLLFLLSTFRVSKLAIGLLTLVGLSVSMGLHLASEIKTIDMLTVSPIVVDGMSNFLRITALLIGILLVLLSWNESGEDKAADYFGCLLVAIAGFSLVGMANDLIFLWLSLEMLSIPTYVMLYLPKKNDRIGQEAAVKYFFLSILSSSLLLFGFSYLYGITGTTNIQAILDLFPRMATGDMASLAVIAAVMFLAGIGFRITAFPFHFYAPDVYQGGPTGVVALLAVVPKIAGFAALIRLFDTIGLSNETSPKFGHSLMLLLWLLAAVTMTAGNVLALMQNNLRRMLAYSSVAHSGYMLMGIAVLPVESYSEEPVIRGGAAILFYLVAYSAMTLGAFAIINYLNTPERNIDEIDDLAGLSETHPRMAALMFLFLISLIGIPLTAGFVGKFFLFMTTMAAPAQGMLGHMYQVLALIAALNALTATYYYLRIIGVMYQRRSFKPAIPLGVNPVLISIIVCAIVTVAFGVYPWPMLSAAKVAIP